MAHAQDGRLTRKPLVGAMLRPRSLSAFIDERR
jgi:hypothetical protein